MAIFGHFWPFIPSSAAPIFLKFLGVVEIDNLKLLVSYYEIWQRKSGWKRPKIVFFGIKSCAKSRRPKNSIGVPLQKSSFGIYFFPLKIEIFPREISDRRWMDKEMYNMKILMFYIFWSPVNVAVPNWTSARCNVGISLNIVRVI